MARMTRILGRLAAVVVPLALGALVIGWAGEFRTPPETSERHRQPTPVRVVTLAPVEMVPRVVGHGIVQPAREWRAVARVDGEVAATAERFAPGEIVPAGTELLRIDETDLRLSLARVEAQLAALDVRNDTLAASLEIGRADLALARDELDRQRRLADQGVAAQAALDQARRQELAARARMTEIENQIALNRAEQAVLQAARAQTARDLEFTTIRAPYDIRLTEVSAEIGQVVGRGQVLAVAEGTEAVEIAARFPLGRMGPLVRLLPEGGAITDLTARVRLPVEGHVASWEADLVRVGEEIEPATQSTVLVVRVADPLGQAQIGARPPLRRNTFVEVVLSAPPRAALVVPVDAVRGGKALVVSADDRLEPRDVTLGLVLDGVAMVADGLVPGDRLVVTDPAVAVPGMAVRPLEDKATAAQVAAAAAGGGTGR